MITNTVAGSILSWLVGKSNIGGKTAYVGLSKGAPTTDGKVWLAQEPPTSAGYARVLIGDWNQSLTQIMTVDSSAKQATNSVEIHFNEATASWNGPYDYACLFGSASGSDLIAYSQLATSINPVANNVVVIPAGKLVIKIE